MDGEDEKAKYTFMEMPRRPSVAKRSVPRAAATAKSAARFKLVLHAAAGKQHLRFLRKHLLAAHALVWPALNELSVALVADAHMRQLHFEFMALDTSTDVLTFPLEYDSSGQETAGEIVVCVDEAARQSRQRGTTVRQELLLYALHGMLHLCGFDDKSEAEFVRMHRKEDQILVQLGIGPVFGAAQTRPPRNSPGKNPASATRRASGRPAAKKRRSGPADVIVGAD